jgi:hypothetical protein
VRAKIEGELRRLRHGAEGMLADGLGTVGFGVQVAKHKATEVIAKATSVLEILDESSLERWPTLEEWRTLLPFWFVAACSPEMTPEEAETWLVRWQRLTDAERRAEEAGKPWSLANWLYWMDPDRRGWWWWEYQQEPGLRVIVQVDEWPFPWGALAWLLRAAGAIDVVPE